MEAFAAQKLMVLHRGFFSEDTKRALALIAADPDSITNVTELFDLPE